MDIIIEIRRKQEMKIQTVITKINVLTQPEKNQKRKVNLSNKLRLIIMKNKVTFLTEIKEFSQIIIKIHRLEWIRCKIQGKNQQEEISQQ